MKRIIYKLRSQSGASITFALLLFLVCAVLSSVIIVAATAASGRMARIAETDQRYYGVTSACELLKELINKKTVSIVKTTTTWTTTEYLDDVAVSVQENWDETGSKDPEVKEYLILDKTAAEIVAAIGTDNDLLTKSNQFLGIGAEGTDLPRKTFLNDAAYKYYNKITIPANESADPKNLSLTSDLAKITVKGSQLDPIATTIEEKLDSDGNITLTVYNTNGDPFKLELSFGADVSNLNPPYEKEDPGPQQNYQVWDDPINEDVTHYSYTITTKKTKAEIVSLTWKFDAIKTLTKSTPKD